jgi:hypothetical protein
MRRCQILLASAEGKRASQIASELHCDTDTTLNAINAFNQRGLQALTRGSPVPHRIEQVWLRFVENRPVSAVTTQYLAWCCEKLERLGKTALIMIWDNASWRLSKEVRTWIRAHNRTVRQQGTGMRIVPCSLPSKSPWLNRIEPHWVHGKRNIVEPARLLTAQEVAERVCAYFGCEHEPHLDITEKVT